MDDIELQPPSPSSLLSPNQSPFDNFDFTNIHSPPFPRTPSYNGSYQNSPFSANSELSFGGEPEPFGLFDDEPAGLTIGEYDPSEYDPPNSSSLLMFNDADYLASYDTNHVSVSVTPAESDHRSFDYSSPSSNGGGDSGAEGEIRSRASSVSSSHRVSPRLDVSQTFENLRFESPNWGTNPLPADPPMSPPNKPQSPPQLRIPAATPNIPNGFPQPPIINAPAGDGGVRGPQLHIVPATPVSGGGAQSQVAPYQSTLKTLHQGPSQSQSTPSSWSHQSDQIALSSEDLHQFRDQTQVAFNFPQHSHEAASSGLSSSTTPQIHSTTTTHQNPNNNFLFPIPPRSRSKSDTSLQVPLWNTGFIGQETMDGGSALDETTGTVNMNDVLPPSNDRHRHPSNSTTHQPSFPHHFNFGGSSAHDPDNGFLSPDNITVNLRRSKSDAHPRPGHRQSRSEDIRSANFPFPPSSQQEFLSRQFLHPGEGIPAIRGHARRASSGSRGVGMTGGSWSNSNSPRPSPYPSPSASPRVRYDELPSVALSGRQAPLLHGSDMDPGMGSLAMMQQQQADAQLAMQQQQPVAVSKPNVTTGRTANASHKRRKQEATFSCPVPGCGSTFTRSFNLKGHLRSHNEEKPFQCHWPGCGKGFARQHDCKRHEQLHTNYRPYTCEGCAKPFARMDALNRHLRSEGGAECQKLQTSSPPASAQGRGYGGAPPALPVAKREADGGWNVLL